MSKARIMSAGTVGTSKRLRVNGPEGGGNALQGLPPICNMRSALVPYVRTRADGENRNVVFCVNQLSGGVGAKRGQFGPGNRSGVGRTGGCAEDYTVLVRIGLDTPFNELDMALLSQDVLLFGGELLNAYEGSTNALASMTRSRYNFLKQEIENAHMSLPSGTWKKIHSSDDDSDLRALLVCMNRHSTKYSWGIPSRCHEAVVAAFGQGETMSQEGWAALAPKERALLEAEGWRDGTPPPPRSKVCTNCIPSYMEPGSKEPIPIH